MVMAIMEEDTNGGLVMMNSGRAIGMNTMSSGLATITMAIEDTIKSHVTQKTEALEDSGRVIQKKVNGNVRR